GFSTLAAIVALGLLLILSVLDELIKKRDGFALALYHHIIRIAMRKTAPSDVHEIVDIAQLAGNAPRQFCHDLCSRHPEPFRRLRISPEKVGECRQGILIIEIVNLAVAEHEFQMVRGLGESCERRMIIDRLEKKLLALLESLQIDQGRRREAGRGDSDIG